MEDVLESPPVGEVREVEKVVEWIIDGISTRFQNPEDFYQSNHFLFADEYWVMKLKRSRETENISFELRRISYGPRSEINFSIGITNEQRISNQCTMYFASEGYGSAIIEQFICMNELKSDNDRLIIKCLLRRMPDVPSKCFLKVNDTSSVSNISIFLNKSYTKCSIQWLLL